jgi:hypothetical protein
VSKKIKGSKRHAEVEDLELAGLHVRMGPPGLIVYARHFLIAAKSTLVPEDAPQFQLVRAFLAARAAELALKAFLSLKNIPLVNLAGGVYGHDLASLLIKSEELGLREVVQLTVRQREEILRAAPYYREKVLEYPSLTEMVRAYPRMPSAEFLLEAADVLVASLRDRCLAG